MEKKNEKGKNIIIVLLLIIVIGLVTLILLVSTGKVNLKLTNNNEQENTQEEIDNNTEEQTQTYIVDLINEELIQENTYYLENKDYFTEMPEDMKLGIKVVLPKLNLDTEGAKSINSKIESYYKEYIDKVNTQEKEQEGQKLTYQDINYTYTIKNNVIYITIEYLYGVYNGTGSTSYNGYYYNIETGQELTGEEALEKLGVSKEDIIDKINNIDNVQTEYKNDLFSNITILPTGRHIEIIANNYTSGFTGNLNELPEVTLEY
jgi:hypothetical protein